MTQRTRRLSASCASSKRLAGLRLGRVPYVLEAVPLHVAGLLVLREAVERLVFVRPLFLAIRAVDHGPVARRLVAGGCRGGGPCRGATARARAFARCRVLVEGVERAALCVDETSVHGFRRRGEGGLLHGERGDEKENLAHDAAPVLTCCVWSLCNRSVSARLKCLECARIE